MKPNIKWREKDLKKLSIYVRKFNTAITRMEKKNPDLVGLGILPERRDVTEIKQRINTRQDYNRELKRIDRLFKPKARDIVIDGSGFRTTRWAKNEERYIEQSVNKKREAYIKNFNIPKNQINSLGIGQVDIKAEKNKILKKMEGLTDPEDILNVQQQWYNFMYTLERESRDNMLEINFYKFRNSYFKGLRNMLPEGVADELIDWLKENDVWGSDIAWAISQNDILDFEAFYSTEDSIDKIQRMIEVWKELLPKLKKHQSKTHKVLK